MRVMYVCGVVCVVLCVCVCVMFLKLSEKRKKKKKKMGLLERHNKFYSGGLLFLLPTFVYLLS